MRGVIPQFDPEILPAADCIHSHEAQRQICDTRMSFYKFA